MKTETPSMPLRYAPKTLSTRDIKAQIRAIHRSRKLYKKHRQSNTKGSSHRFWKSLNRPHVSSFPHKTSRHIQNAKKIYNLDRIVPDESLSKATGCSISALQAIVKKGEGAYYSSGSRPNQTPQSWGYARLASSVTGGNASIVDYNILEQGCKCTSLALKLAKERKKKGLRKTRKI
jgi:hypothetical protein